MLISLLIIVIILSLTLTTNGQYVAQMFSRQIAHAELEEEVNSSLKLIRENSRSANHITEFMTACTDKVRSGDLSLLSTCNALLQKFNIDIGQFFIENQAVIEEMIYPYSIPSSAASAIGLNSSGVVGTDDMTEGSKHAFLASDYMGKLAELSKECASRAEASEISSVRNCINIMSSLNDHIRTFNSNAKPDFDKVLIIE
jgi:hypothetical protein